MDGTRIQFHRKTTANVRKEEPIVIWKWWNGSKPCTPGEHQNMIYTVWQVDVNLLIDPLYMEKNCHFSGLEPRKIGMVSPFPQVYHLATASGRTTSCGSVRWQAACEVEAKRLFLSAISLQLRPWCLEISGINWQTKNRPRRAGSGMFWTGLTDAQWLNVHTISNSRFQVSFWPTKKRERETDRSFTVSSISEIHIVILHCQMKLLIMQRRVSKWTWIDGPRNTNRIKTSCILGPYSTNGSSKSM